MIEPIITTGAALVGATAWFADKLLGPSATEIGDQLKVYLSDRWRKISKRTEELAEGRTVKALPPGFAYLALQKASFSEDDEAITTMWANLFLDASAEFSNRHTLYADILSQIGPAEARSLDGLCSNKAIEQLAKIHGNVDALANAAFRPCAVGIEDANSERSQAYESAAQAMLSYPVQPAFVGVANVGVSGGSLVYQSKFEYDEMAFAVLQRQNLVSRFHTESDNGMVRVIVDGFSVTMLGVDFYKTCKGMK